ncbi:MAG: MATE family efflux transporter [Alphaproteobacteria bacterium]
MGHKLALPQTRRQAAADTQGREGGEMARDSDGSAVAARMTRAEVWRLAWPIMLANVSIPLLGLADTAVIGNVGTTASLGAIAIGAILFNFIYWGFGFLRMGTTGLVSQAYGAEDGLELKATLARAFVVAGAIGILLMAGQTVIAWAALPLFAAEPPVEALARTYYGIRIWGAPAVLGQYVVLGWFIGSQDSRPVLILQIFQNLTNIALNLILVLGFDLGVAGVAFGTLAAEALTLLLGLWMIRLRLDRTPLLKAAPALTRARVFDPPALMRTFTVNRDIMLRTLFLVAGFSWFTAMGSRLGPTTLAGNHVLMQFLAFSAFFLDGWAIAAEGLVGRAVGGRSRAAFERAVRLSTELAAVTSLGLTVLFFAGGPWAIRGLTDIEAVRAAAMTFLPYAALHPVIGVWCFQFDGIFVGATRSQAMRNAMLESFVLYLAAWWLLQPWGNHGLWAAFLIFFAARGATLAVRYRALSASLGPQPSN